MLAAAYRKIHELSIPAIYLWWSITHILMLLWISNTEMMYGDLDYYSHGTADGKALNEYPLPVALFVNALSHLPVDTVQFRYVFVGLCMALDLMCLTILIAKHHKHLAVRWVLARTALGAITYCRLDMFVAIGLFIAIAFYADQRHSVGINIAAATKLWPGALAFMIPRGTTRFRQITATISIAIGWVLLTLIVGGWDRLVSPLKWQSGRGFQVESFSGSIIGLHHALTNVSGDHVKLSHNAWEYSGRWADNYAFLIPAISMAGYILIVAVLCATARLEPSRENMTIVTLVTALIFMLTSPVLSPQYLTWLLPLIVFCPYAYIRYALLGACALTQYIVQFTYDKVFAHDAEFLHFTELVLARNLILASVAVVLTARLFAPLFVPQSTQGDAHVTPCEKLSSHQDVSEPAMP